MFRNKNKLAVFQRTTLVVVLTAGLFVFYPAPTQAAFWPTIDPIINRMLNTVYETIQGIILGAAKQAAVKTLNSQVDSLVSGKGAGGAAFITNWTDYLVTQPKNNTKVYMNSRLTQMTAGRGSSSGYSSEGFSGAGGYANSLVQMEKNKLDQKDTVPTLTYQGNPKQMFDGGNFKNLDLYFSGINNPAAFDMSAQDAYQQKLAEEKTIGQTKAVAYQGFKGTSSASDPNIITYPGILTKENVANVENLPNNVIASAKSIPEVISSIVSQMITKEIQQGFSGIQKSAQTQTTSQNKLNSGINSAVKTNGPGVLYGN